MLYKHLKPNCWSFRLELVPIRAHSVPLRRIADTSLLIATNDDLDLIGIRLLGGS